MLIVVIFAILSNLAVVEIEWRKRMALKGKRRRVEPMLNHIKRGMLQFFENNDLNRRVLEITDIRILDDKQGYLEFEVTLNWPGLLIGKGGWTIDALIEYLKEYLSKEQVVIKIKESKLWKYTTEF